MDASEEIIVLSDEDDDGKPINDNKNGSNIFGEFHKFDEEKQQNDSMDEFAPPQQSEEQLYFGNDDFMGDDGLMFDMEERKEEDEQQCPTTSQELFNRMQQKPPKTTLKRPNNKEQKKEDEDEGKEEAEEMMPAKRKKRTKEEIEQEKLEKQVNKIRREILSSKNSKCEKYLFCHCSTRILQIDDQIEEELRKRFEERGIPGQIIFDNSPTQTMRIIWKRKRIDAAMDDGKLISKELMEVQNCFFSVLSGDTFTQLAKAKNGILDYIKEQIAANKMKRARLTLVILGKHAIRENTVDSLIFEAYEQFGAQFRFVRDALDFSFIVVQMHRSLAKFEKKAEKMVEEAGTFIAEKGIADGPGMVADWWTKMLDHMHRMSEDQKRAIVQAHPNPVKLMDRLLDPNNSPGNSMFILSEIQMKNGRRLGPVLAQKIYKMLTSLDGTEIIDSGE